MSHTWLFIHLWDLSLNQNTYTVREQLQSHLSGLNYSTPVNYSFRKICSNHTSIVWFTVQEESSPLCAGGGELTPASAAEDTSAWILQQTSSRTCSPTSPASFYSAVQNNMKHATVTLAFTSRPSLLFCSFLCHYLESWKSCQWVWIFTSSM